MKVAMSVIVTWTQLYQCQSEHCKADSGSRTSRAAPLVPPRPTELIMLSQFPAPSFIRYFPEIQIPSSCLSPMPPPLLKRFSNQISAGLNIYCLPQPSYMPKQPFKCDCPGNTSLHRTTAVERQCVVKCSHQASNSGC